MSAHFFKLLAPFFGAFGDRWSPRQLDDIAAWLRPHVPPGGTLVDVGGGTGALATHLGQRLDASAIVVDPSRDMLAYMKPSPRVRGVVGTAEALPLDDSSADAIVVTDAFHHFPDQDGAAREFARVVRCEGGVVIVEFDTSGWLFALPALERLAGEPATFLSRGEMCAFFAERGITGRCERHGPISYRFIGTVNGAEPDQPAQR